MQFLNFFRMLRGRTRPACRFGNGLLVLALYYLPSAWAAPLTLEQAWQQAEQANPDLRAAQANLAAAQGELTDARALLWHNPQLSSEWRHRTRPQTTVPAQSSNEWTLGFAQTFEIAGQQRLRYRVAEQALAATQAVIDETRRQVRAEVEQQFVRVLALQQRIQMEERTLKLVENAASAIGKRVTAGEDSRLDGNLARVEAARAQNQVASLREQLIQNRAALATLLQLPTDSLPEPVGSLDAPSATYTLDALLNAATNRPLLRAYQHQQQSAESRLALERAAVYPDITVGVNTAREGLDNPQDRISGLSVSLPLPLFRRNATGIGRATTELARAQAQQQVGQRDARAQVLALWARRENLQARVKELSETVLPRLEENQHLSSIAFRAGEIGLLQLLLVNRQVLDGQRDLLEARTELRLAKAALEAAAGWPAMSASATQTLRNNHE